MNREHPREKTGAALRYLHNPVAAVILLLLAIVLSFLGWYISSQYMHKRAADRFEFRIHELKIAISKRMLEYEQVLRGGVGLFNATDSITFNEWREYVNTLRIDQYFPGIQGLGYSVRIPSEKLEEHVRFIRAALSPAYDVRPAYKREEYHSIIFLEPFSGRNLRAFGYDMFSEAVRREAMSRARDSGGPALSGVVRLVQETKQDVQNGFLLYIPVYSKGLSVTNVEQRRAALKGFVYSPFRIKDLMRGILGERRLDIEFAIYDGNQPHRSSLLYATDTIGGNSYDFSDTTDLTIAGRRWTIAVNSKPNLINSSESIQPVIIAALGILLDIIVFYVLISVSWLNRRNRELAEVFRAEKEKYELIALSTNDVIWDWNLQTNRVKWNENYHYSFGYHLKEHEGSAETWSDHIHPSDKDRVLKGIYRIINSGQKSWSDEYRFVRSDGSIAHINDRGYIVYDKENKPIRMVGSMIDVTEQRKAEEAQARFTKQLESIVDERTEELMRSNEELQQFAHVASHDMKEPVRKIKAFANLLENEYSRSFPEKAQLFLDKIQTAADRIKSMVDGVLLFSSLNTGEQKTELINLNGLMQQVQTDLELPIHEKGARFTILSLPVIRGARVLIYQLFYNLINNSLKFARKDEQLHITITSEVVNGNVIIRLKDNGIGFDSAYAMKIFEPFSRLHSKDEYEGTGLGLALCRRIVLRHHGSISASGEEGKGAVFTVILPLEQAEGKL